MTNRCLDKSYSAFRLLIASSIGEETDYNKMWKKIKGGVWQYLDQGVESSEI